MPNRDLDTIPAAHVAALLAVTGERTPERAAALTAQIGRRVGHPLNPQTVLGWMTGQGVPTSTLLRALLAALDTDKNTVVDLLPPAVLLPALWCPRLGDELHRLRTGAGHTRETLAQLAGVSASTIHRWEQATTVPRSAQLAKLLAALDANAATLLPLGDWPVTETPNGTRGLFGTWLVAQRTSRQVTQTDLARQVHVTQAELSSWESGRSYPGAGRWEELAAAFTTVGMPIGAAQLHRMQLPERVPAHVLDGSGPVARLLVEARLAQRMCRQVAAEAVGVPAVTLAAWERGSRVPATEAWPMLRSVLELTLEQVTETLLVADGHDRDLPGWVRARRTALGLRNRDLASRLGVHRNTVHRWECRHDPIEERRYRPLARVLRCSVAQLRLAAHVEDHDELDVATGLRDLRRRRLLTQQQAADLLGVDQPTISKVENRRADASERLREAYLALLAA